MAAAFCWKCGTGLPSDAAFCPACGSPTAGPIASGTARKPAGAPATPTIAPPSPEPANPGVASVAPGLASASAPPLSTVLGLLGSTQFLLQHASVVGARRYLVLGRDKRPQFQLQEDPAQESEGVVSAEGAGLGGTLRPRVWNLSDPAGTFCGRVTVQESALSVDAMLEDVTGGPVVHLAIVRGPTDAITAEATYPDGRPMLSARGSFASHTFVIHDPSGAEVARIHEAWASVHDAFGVELVGPVDPVAALILALMIDRERAERDAAAPRGRPGRPGGGPSFRP